MHQPLTIADLYPHGPGRRLGSAVHLFDEIDSTNRWLLDQIQTLADGALAASEFQSAGRGRLGRTWLAPRGSSVMLSMLLVEPIGSRLIELVGLAAACAACHAIEAVTDVSPAVRWPNDIVADSRKLGGVLVETAPSDEQHRGVVIGIGLNCLQHSGHFPEEIRHKATSLEIEASHPIDRAALAAALLSDFDRRVASFDSPGTLSEWHGRCIDIGRTTELIHAGQHYTGTVIDVSLNADLVVQLATGGRRSFEAATTTRQI
jgi:BirA family biotin operon repressor/biotin-[acetyl-CoA-carboxylase] ligase